MKPHQWLREHSLKLLAIRDTPQAIAGGVAIGIFFGFVPLFGLKTVLALFFAWLTRSNIVATILAATGHEILFPLMPVIYLWQYKIGFWLLNDPHGWPASVRKMNWSPHELWRWDNLRKFGIPLLLGGCVCSGPVSLMCFFITRFIVARHQRKHAEKTATEKSSEDLAP